MMVKEDGAEKTKQLAVGMIILSIAGWLAWQWWFGIGLFEGQALVEGQYGSAASSMIQVGVLLVTQVGAIALGLFRTGASILSSVAGFFFGEDKTGTEVNTSHSINVNVPSYQPAVTQISTESPAHLYANDGSRVLVKKEVPIFRTDENGALIRDLELESHVCGPRTKAEIAQDAVDALMSGDGVRVKERFKQLHADETPKKTPIDAEVVVEDAKSTKA